MKMLIFPGFKQRIVPFAPDTLEHRLSNFSYQTHQSQKHQESLKNCSFGQILNSSLIFDPLPLSIFGLNSISY